MAEDTAKEERVDKTSVLKQLIELGRKRFLLQKYIDLYRDGKCSLDKAAEAVGITVSEMMDETMNEGITSTETVEEYREGLKHLQNT